MMSILRPGLLILLVTFLLAATACGPSPRLARDAEAKILADEEGALRKRLTRWRKFLRVREARAGQGPTGDLDDDDEEIIALRMTISQDLARLRQCGLRRAELSRRATGLASGP